MRCSEGQARITLFASSHNARTFNYQSGDIGVCYSVTLLLPCLSCAAYIPASFGHYVENTGNTSLRYLEIFNTGPLSLLFRLVALTLAPVADRYQDVSLTQWLALTPPSLVKAHLNLSDETIANLSKTKGVVV
jgi:oxalate decarboxylase/phosphoglucose isomerase-like protein (cupin superfamily)